MYDTTKLCLKCKQHKNLEQFVKNKSSKDGKHYYCYECNRLIFKQRYKAHPRKLKDTTKLSDLTELDKSYMAGYFDGEGCIVIAEEKNKKGGIISYRIQLHVGSRDILTIKWIHDKFGGRIQKSHVKGKSYDMFYWLANSLEAGDILQSFEKYLKLKQERAMYVKKFLELGRGYHKEKNDIKIIISKLNRRE